MIMAVIISFRSSHSVRPIIVSYLSSSHFVGYLTLLRSASVRPSVVRSRVIAVLKVKSSEKGACFAPFLAPYPEVVDAADMDVVGA